MTRSAQCGRDPRGFSVMELLLALGLVAVVLAALVPSARGWYEGGKFRATLKTAAGLAEAVRQYRATTGAWPATWNDLVGRYLPNGSPATAWGAGFTLTATANYAEITTIVPVTSPPSALVERFASVRSVPGGTEITVRVPVPGDATDLEYERKRLVGS